VAPWNDVSRAKFLIKTDSILFLRFPNGLLHSFLFKVSRKLSIERSIARFLVFHEYCFTPAFVKKLLSDHGFADILICNASLSGESLIHRFRRLHGLPQGIEAMEKLTDLISGGRILWGPSLNLPWQS
jgi:hypothetical protein